MTTNAKIYIALRNHLKTFENAPTIIEPDQLYEPPLDANGLPAPYWIIDDVRLPLRTRYIDNSAGDDYRGSFQIHTMTPPRGEGHGMTHAQRMYAVDQVAALFPRGLNLWVDDLRLQITETPHSAGVPYVDNGYIRLPVLIPWLCA